VLNQNGKLRNVQSEMKGRAGNSPVKPHLREGATVRMLDMFQIRKKDDKGAEKT
jgi:hypothetical protein